MVNGKVAAISVAALLVTAAATVAVLDHLNVIYLDNDRYNERAIHNPSAEVNTTAESTPSDYEVNEFPIEPLEDEDLKPDMKSNLVVPNGSLAGDEEDARGARRSLLHHGTCPGWHQGTKTGTVFLSIKFTQNGVDSWYECSGTSIGDRKILTAAHCVTKHSNNGSYIWASQIIVTDISGNQFHVDERTLYAFNGYLNSLYVSHDIAWFKTWSQVTYNTGAHFADQSGWQLFVAYMFNHSNKVYDYSWGQYKAGQKCPGGQPYQSLCGSTNYKNIVTSINVIGGNSGSGVYEYNSSGTILGISGVVSVGSCSTMQAGTLTSSRWSTIQAN